MLLNTHAPLTCLSIAQSTLVSGSTDHSLYCLRNSLQFNLYRPRGHSEWVSCVLVLNPLECVSGGMDSRICLWNLSSKHCDLLTGHQGPITHLAIFDFLPQSLISSSYDGTLKRWDLKTRKCISTYHPPPVTLDYMESTRIPILVFQALSSTHFISGTRSGSLWVHDIATGALLHVIKAHQGPIHHLAVKDQNVIYSAGAKDGYVRAFNLDLPLEKGRRILNLKVSPGGISNLALCSNVLFCTGGGLGQVHVIDSQKVHSFSCRTLRSVGAPGNTAYCLRWAFKSLDAVSLILSWGDGMTLN